MPHRILLWSLILILLSDCAATNLDSRRYRRVRRTFDKMFIHVDNQDNAPFLDKLGKELADRLEKNHGMAVELFIVDSISLKEARDEKKMINEFDPQAMLDIRLTVPEYSNFPAEPNKGPFIVDLYAGGRYTIDLYIHNDPDRIWRGRLKTRELLQTSTAVQQSIRQITRTLSYLHYIPREIKEKPEKVETKQETVSGE